MTTIVEIIALVAGLGYAIGAVLRNRWAWASGALSSALLSILAFGVQLPLQGFLQAIYVGMAGYGFWRWSQATGDGRVVVQRWAPWQHVVVLVGTLGLVFLGEDFFAEELGSVMPRLDAAVTCLSLCATVMTARGILENWCYWWLVNAASMWLYATQGLFGVVLLYAVYFLIALVGWRQWLQVHRQQIR